MMRKRFNQSIGLLILTLCLGIGGTLSTIAHAATTPEQRKAANELTGTARRIQRLADSGKTRDAMEQFEMLYADVSKLAGEKPDAELLQLLAPILKNMEEIRALLELEGFKVPPPLSFAAAEKPTDTPMPAGDGKVSFSTQIAPLLAGKCGRCHIDASQGKVNMATFVDLMKGSETDGTIIFPGKSKGSRIIDVIESGDMPRGGSKISAEELALLAKWIDEGAVNDSGSDNSTLRQLAMRARRDMPELTVEQATGNEKVKFGLHIAPVLIDQCVGCHGARQPAGGLGLLTFARLLRGGDSGTVLVPGKPDESLLLKKIKGTAGDRMPRRKPPLSDEVIAQFETWIAEGAKFDGDAEDLPIERVAAVSLARSQTPAELSKDRIGFTEKNWHLAIPDDKAAMHETENFLLIGNVGEKKLEETGEMAEKQLPLILKALHAKPTDKLLKGRLTIYVMANRYDYSEFGTMIEKRSLPKAWEGHWNYDIVDPYVLLLKPSSSDTYSLSALLTQQLASIYIAARTDGKGPRWLAEGTGRALAAKMEAKDPRVLAWDEQIPDALARMQKPDDFMTGKLSPEDSDLLSFSFIRLLMTKPTNFGQLLTSTAQGMPVDQALTRAFGGSPAQIATAWVGYISK